MLSIITDFGCSKGCQYCIHRQQLRSKPDQSNRYYESLELAVCNSGGNVFSISGGGDPLHDFDKNSVFWNYISSLCRNRSKQIDLHTAYLDELLIHWSFFEPILRKAVVHCFPQTWESDKSKVLELLKISPMSRINFVAEESLKHQAISIEAFCHENKISFSYRELISNYRLNDITAAFFRDVRERTRYGFYIHQDDYNIYFTPAGELKLRYTEV